MDNLSAQTTQNTVGTVAADKVNNLDILAAQIAQSVVSTADKPKDLENMATKALGVLQENGVYAGMLFLYSKTNDADAQSLRENLLKALGRSEMSPFKVALPDSKDKRRWQDVSGHLTDQVCADLDTLLLVKQVWEQTLIYVRYGAKARG